jgi:hypothetical protein
VFFCLEAGVCTSAWLAIAREENRLRRSAVRGLLLDQ